MLQLAIKDFILSDSQTPRHGAERRTQTVTNAGRRQRCKHRADRKCGAQRAMDLKGARKRSQTLVGGNDANIDQIASAAHKKNRGAFGPTMLTDPNRQNSSLKQLRAQLDGYTLQAERIANTTPKTRSECLSNSVSFECVTQRRTRKRHENRYRDSPAP